MKMKGKQTLRDVLGFAITEYFGGRLLKSLGGVAHSRIGWSVGNNPWVKGFANSGIDIGLGTLLGYLAK